MDDQTRRPVPEICLIAPTDHLAAQARMIIAQKKLPIGVYTAALDQAVELARGLMKQGAWLFISRKGTRDLLELKLRTTVVNIPLVASDYIPAIQRAQTQQGIIAFFSAEEANDELLTICYLMNIKARNYQFSDNESCRQCVALAIAEGSVMGIGGSVSGQYAKEAGLPYILVESSDSSLIQALETACQMRRLHKEEEQKREQLEIRLERYENILNYTHDAILVVDEEGRIEVTNKVAKRMLRHIKFPVEGRPVEEVIPGSGMGKVLQTGKLEEDQLINVGGTMVSSNQVPIIVNQKVKGVVATFRDVKSLQTAEQSIRIKLHEKGLTAKYHFSDIVGSSEVLADVKELAQDFADSQFTVMLYGETGTGKEMFAQSMHHASPRQNGPFVAVNCTALSKSLLEAELFGYVEGAFTGAKKGGKPGLFEIAHGGTIFLDEIGKLPFEFQAQFLRVLQEKEVRRVGGEYVIPVDIRVIGATNSNLLELVEEGSFRRDLYYRLNVLNLTVPPLRERGNDYLQIAESIYRKARPEYSAKEQEDFFAIMRRYEDYEWPGNVRELNNMVERICLLQKKGTPGQKILLALQMMGGYGGMPSAAPALPDQIGSLKEWEETQIRDLLIRNGGNVSRTAQELKISRSTLYRKLKQSEN